MIGTRCRWPNSIDEFRSVPCAYHNSNEVKAYTDVPSFHSYMPGQELDAEIQRRLVHGYYACTSYTDAQIGRVLDALRKVGLDDNTISSWCGGDHGYHLGIMACGAN